MIKGKKGKREEGEKKTWISTCYLNEIKNQVFCQIKKLKKKLYQKMPASALKVTIKLFKAENQFTSQLGQQTKASVSVFLDPIAFVWLTKPGREKITWNR